MLIATRIRPKTQIIHGIDGNNNLKGLFPNLSIMVFLVLGQQGFFIESEQSCWRPAVLYKQWKIKQISSDSRQFRDFFISDFLGH